MGIREEIDQSARAALAGDLTIARQHLEQAMAHPDAIRYAGRIERGRAYLIRRGAYDAPWQPNPKFCVACFIGRCDGEHDDE